MKKKYISPEALTIQFGTCKMMAVSSPNISTDYEATPVQGSELDVKENNDINLWDEE